MFVSILPAIFYYIDYVLKLTGFLTMLPLILVFLMIFGFIFVFNLIIRKIGVKKTFIIALFWTGMSFLLLFFMISFLQFFQILQ